MTLQQPKSSEPRFLANVQRYFADFPYFLCLMQPEAIHLGDLLRLSVRFFWKEQALFVFSESTAYLHLLAKEGKQLFSQKGTILSLPCGIAPLDAFSYQNDTKTLKRKENSS